MTIAQSLERLDDLLRRARKAGADAADAVFVQGASLSIAERLGKPEKLERAEGRDLGLRVFVGKRQAIVSSSDISSQALGELAQRAIAMAKAVPERSSRFGYRRARPSARRRSSRLAVANPSGTRPAAAW